MVKNYLPLFLCCVLIDVAQTMNVGFKISMSPSTSFKSSPSKVKKKICENEDIGECFMQVCSRRYSRYKCSRRNLWRQYYRLLFSDLCSYVGTCRKYRWPWFDDDVDVLTCKKNSHCLRDQRCIKGICWDEFQDRHCLHSYDCADMYICDQRECRLPPPPSKYRDQSSKQTFSAYFYLHDSDSGISYREFIGYDCSKDGNCKSNERCYQQKCMPKRQGKRCQYDKDCDSAYYCSKRECYLRPKPKKKLKTRPSCYSDYDCGNPSLYVCKNRRCVRRKCIFEDDEDCYLPYRQGKSCDSATDCRPEYTCLYNECVLGDWNSR